MFIRKLNCNSVIIIFLVLVCVWLAFYHHINIISQSNYCLGVMLVVFFKCWHQIESNLHIVPSFSYLFPLQLVLLGDSGVGKSCIVLRFVRGQFDPTSKVKLATNVFRFHELYVHCTLTFSHVLFRFTFFHLMNLGNCWCIIFVTNIGIRGLHNSEV